MIGVEMGYRVITLVPVMAAIIRSAAGLVVTACGDDGCGHAAVDAGCGLAAFRERPPGARV